jgi:RNA recognition motif-containing protein
MSIKLFVRNLSPETSGEDLWRLFAQAGTVESASVLTNRDTGRSRGIAFVSMATREEGQAAVERFDGAEVGGRTLKVREAKPYASRGSYAKSRGLSW